MRILENCFLSFALASCVLAQSVITTAIGSDWVFPASVTPLTAPLGEIRSVAVDRDGNVFGADCNNHFVFRVDTQGVFSIVAGNGVRGSSPDGPATGVRLVCPRDLLIHSSGELYFHEGGPPRIRKLTLDGQLVTVAGGGRNFDEGAPALEAKIWPYCLGPIALDSSTTARRSRRSGCGGSTPTGGFALCDRT